MRRRLGKEWRERLLAVIALVPFGPLIAACAAAIKLEAVLYPDARGPVFFVEARVARGRVIGLIKLRTLNAAALSSLGEGPTHIATLERKGELTRVGRVLKRWYLDELPQLWNIVRGDMGLIGTRPYPLELYEEELARGITRKRDMPSGLVGPVQAAKGDPRAPDDVSLDERYWDLYQHGGAWDLLLTDIRLLLRAAGVQLRHEGL